MTSYNPSAIVLQCGTDSLAGDKLGCFNLSMRGKQAVVCYRSPHISLDRSRELCELRQIIRTPVTLIGGGGYTMRNVSRAWAYETGLATGMELGPSKDPLI